MNHKRVARVMRTIGLAGLRLCKKHRTTIPDPAAVKDADLIGRDFTAEHPNAKYVGDITYLPVTGAKPLYLATVIDLCSRRLAGWAIADHMRAELVVDALAAAEQTRGSLGAIFHSDHGSQYTSAAFADACERAGVRRSMSAVGSSADNAAAESWNASTKRETLKGAKAWPTARHARPAAFRRASRYNTRRHSRLGQRSPIAYENALYPPSTTLPEPAQPRVQHPGSGPAVVRGHPGAANSAHHIRDVTFAEDTSTVHTGTAPRAMATLRNIAIGVLKTLGADNIAKTTRAIRDEPERALPLLGTTNTPATQGALKNRRNIYPTYVAG